MIDLHADPELERLFNRFVEQEVKAQSRLDGRTRMLAVLSALVGSGGTEAFRLSLEDMQESGLGAIAIREVLYQATAYVGIGRVLPFLAVFNEQVETVALPEQGTTDEHNRQQKGSDVQVAIFGEAMRGFASSGPEEKRHINRWLAANCFGDYYTRGGLNLQERELATFCFLASSGGCEPQLCAHIKGNDHLGNGRLFLIDVVSQMLPYIGYPKSLNALRCIDEVLGNSR